MGERISKIYSYSITVDHKPGEVGRLLKVCSEHNVNLINLTAYPLENNVARIDLFPEYGENLKNAAEIAGVTLNGPLKAFMIKGTDRPGVIIDYHLKLAEAGVNVASANGTSFGDKGFGYIIQVDPDEYDKAADALGLVDKHNAIWVN